MKLGPREDALRVYQIKDEIFGGFLRFADRWSQFDCDDGKFHYDNTVLAYDCHMGQNQYFFVHDDMTISPTCAPDMFWAWNGENLCLRNKTSKGVLVFDGVVQTYQPTHYMNTTLKSHPGKGIVFTGETR